MNTTTAHPAEPTPAALRTMLAVNVAALAARLNLAEADWQDRA
ncbi:hypothetical protein ACH0AG_03985 [Micrococcus luteus]